MSGNPVDNSSRKENKVAPDRSSVFLLWLLPVAFTAALTMVVSRSLSTALVLTTSVAVLWVVILLVLYRFTALLS